MTYNYHKLFFVDVKIKIMLTVIIIILIAVIIECKNKTVKKDVIVDKSVAVNKSSRYLNQENKEAERKHKKNEDQEKYYYWDKDERWEKKQRKKNRDKNRYKDSDSDEDWDKKDKKYWKEHKKHRDEHRYSDDSEEYGEKKHKNKKHRHEDSSYENSETSDSDETDEYRDKKHRDKKHYWDDWKKHREKNEYSVQEKYWDTGTKAHVLDLKGFFRLRFSYECMEALNGRSSVCSPLSALKPIGMLAFGAEGAALDEILNAIGISHLSSVKSHFKDILHGIVLRTNGLHMASRIYIHNHKSLHSSFKHQAESVFGSCIEQLNLRDQGNAASEINSWVKYHTNNKVDGILSPDDISGNTVAVIVDAIYFWGRWKHPFEHVKSETFYAAHGERSASMMCNFRNYKYGQSKELDAQVIEIPYQDRELKLIILLPLNRGGLGALIRQLKLAPELINNVRMSKKKVQLQLPKFKIETSLNLNSLYQRVGLKKMFDPHYGLTKVLTHDKVYVNKGIQRVFIYIDQEGTEAGGYGATFGGSHNEEKQQVVFHANHPFMFFITFKKQQLFAGVLQ